MCDWQRLCDLDAADAATREEVALRFLHSALGSSQGAGA
jgi:hypothetical protein